MAKIGVLIETEKNEIKKTNFGTITAARDGGKNEVVALLLAVDANPVQETLAAYGAQKIVQVNVEGADLESSPDQQARALADAIQHFALEGLVGLASTRGRDVFARLSAQLNVPLASDCVGINFDDKTVRKSHFSGKTIATIKLNSDLLLCALRPNAIEAQEAPVDAQVEIYTADAGDRGFVKINGGGVVLQVPDALAQCVVMDDQLPAGSQLSGQVYHLGRRWGWRPGRWWVVI